MLTGNAYINDYDHVRALRAPSRRAFAGDLRARVPAHGPRLPPARSPAPGDGQALLRRRRGLRRAADARVANRFSLCASPAPPEHEHLWRDASLTSKTRMRPSSTPRRRFRSNVSASPTTHMEERLSSEQRSCSPLRCRRRRVGGNVLGWGGVGRSSRRRSVSYAGVGYPRSLVASLAGACLEAGVAW
jgi:hypothetical protein